MSENKLNTSNNKILKEVLELDYFRIKDFFEDICQKNYKYVILLTRRCLILADMFFQNGIISKKDGMKFISDYAICTILDKIEKDDRICIVDDILIHGRKVKQILDLVELSSIKKENIDIRVCIKNVSDTLFEENDSTLKYNLCASASLWRDSSNRIVQSILELEKPYVSYVNYFLIDEDFGGWRESILSDFCDYNINIFDDYGIKFQVAYGIERESLKLLNKISYLSCIRKYIYSSGKTIIIPYVFLKSIRRDLADSFFNKIANALNTCGLNTISSIFSYTLPENSENDYSNLKQVLNEYKYNILTMFISWAYGIYVCNDCKTIYYDIENSVIKYSILDNAEQIINELNEITPDKAEELLSLYIDISSEYFMDDLSLDDEYLQALSSEVDTIIKLDDNSDCKDIWDRYVYNSFCVDEERAANGKKRLSGVPLEYIWNALKKDIPLASTALEKLLGEIIGTWDIGRTSCSAGTKKSNSFELDYIGNFVCPGEQAYRTIFMKFIDALQCLYNIIRERCDGETEKDAIEKFCNYAKNTTGVLREYQYQIIELKDIILKDLNSNRLFTLIRPISNENLFLEVNKYTIEHREGIV